MSEKEKGLFKKYEVVKLTNPTKNIDGIVLEFDDELSHDAIWEYALTMFNKGYKQFYSDIIEKLNANGGNYRNMYTRKNNSAL